MLLLLYFALDVCVYVYITQTNKIRLMGSEIDSTKQ